MAALYRNITARKRAEEALCANEKRLRLIVEDVRDYGVFTTMPRIASTPGCLTPPASSAGARRRRSGALPP